jgi:GrpB-like predicted nucleotidyltransferase (UPF0157 family)
VTHFDIWRQCPNHAKGAATAATGSAPRIGIVGTIRIQPEAAIRAAAETTFEEHRARVLEVLPGVDVEHVGATSIPGALTKGDVDVLVRVEPGAFDAAVAELRRLYAVHQPENWTPTYASFVERGHAEPPVGVQLVVTGSSDDAIFGPLREALIEDPALLAEYNALKLRYDGRDYEHYTEAKGRFIERTLEKLNRRSV